MFAQINYSQIQGISGKYTIHDIGCFLTSFCNLAQRFGENVDPPTLNQYFINHKTYIDVDDGVKDDLGWGSVSAYDGNIVVTQIGGAGWPDSNDAIVKFAYKSPRTGKQTTHFCLVQDHAAKTIIDSWDGVIKHSSTYGTPVAWAKYERHQPQPVTPPAPQETPAFTIENIAKVTKQLKIDTHLWDLNQRTWPGLANHPVGNSNAGALFDTEQIAHHILGGSYYLPVGSQSQGYNEVDCQDPAAAPAPAPAPTPEPIVDVTPPAPSVHTDETIDGIRFQALDGAPRQMWISRQGGTEKWNFKDVNTWRGFKSVGHFDYGTEIWISGVAHHPIPPKGADYYMTGDDFGDFKATGKPANYYGFNWSDISDKKPPALPEPVAAPVVSEPTTTPAAPEPVAPPTTVTTPPADTTTPVNWKATYRPFPAPAEYVATRNLTVVDLAGQQPEAHLPKYSDDGAKEIGVVKAYGTVTKDGIDYYRLRTNNDPTFSFWYCVPKIDPTTKTPNLLVKPAQPLEPVAKVTLARDGIQLVKEEATKFLDDIMPTWFKNKK